MQRRPAFASDTLTILRALIDSGPRGNRWYKVNLHVHAGGNDPVHIVQSAREAAVDIIAITDHQTFQYYDGVADAARTSGRSLVVLPGIEITSQEGIHILALFPLPFESKERERFIGYLEIPGTGVTNVASKKSLGDIFRKVDKECHGIVVVPHPFTSDIGMLDRARKMSTRIDWLDSGYVRLIQIDETEVRYLDFDPEGNWVNRYILSSARPKDIATSHYCLAPFNRSDARTPAEVANGCSWFRMAESTIEGLRQVACEPRSRIARSEPSDRGHSAIVALRVRGGYCDGQMLYFNDALNCLVGENYAGKSAILDFIRFALTDETGLSDESRRRLLSRLKGILTDGGQVELFLLRDRSFYVVRRTFEAQYDEFGVEVLGCQGGPTAYRYASDSNELLPENELAFPLEVYEQGQIGKLRESAERQLALLDDFAGTKHLVTDRASIIDALNRSALRLAPLYDERDTLLSDVNKLSELKKGLGEIMKVLPNQEEERRWANATVFANGIEDIIDRLRRVAPEALDGDISEDEFSSFVDGNGDDNLHELFHQEVPTLDLETVAEAETLGALHDLFDHTLADIEKAREAIVRTIEKLASDSKPLFDAWNRSREEHERELTARLRRAGFESPAEILERVKSLRAQVHTIETKKQPRLSELKKRIDHEETARETLLSRLRDCDRRITELRQAKARELTTALEDRIRISVRPAGDTAAYAAILEQLYARIATRDFSIKNRVDQFNRIVSSISPLDLALALQNKGRVQHNNEETTLVALCGITEHTQDVLCILATDVKLLNELQTTPVSDVPSISVRRRNETTYADLRSELSPGEQSAAILMLALQARNMPLILDQPEDELGYSYVVHLVVPKMLAAKFSRQLIVVTHNANVPVLGDADYVIKMRNEPNSTTGRRCFVGAEGGFELASVTDALLELEGGEQAFRFRFHRYRLPPLGPGAIPSPSTRPDG